MADTNLNILVRVEGAKEASTEISSVSRSTAQVGKQTEETSKRTANLRKTLSTVATGFLVYKGAQWIKSAVTETTSLAKATVGLQRITGMDAKTASGWVAIAKERGVQAKALNMGFISLAKNSAGLAKGTKSSVEMFHQLGISTKQWQSLNTEQRMEAVANSFTKMRNPAERAALAQKLFGRQAQTLLPLLTQGKQKLHEQVTEMGKSTGMSGKSVAEQLRLVKAQREMNAAMLSLKVAVATALMPIMLSLAQVLAPLTAGFAKLMQGSGAFRVIVVALTASLVVFIATMKLMQLAAVGARTALMTSGIGAIIVGIAVAIMLLYTKCAWFRAAVHAVMQGVVVAFSWVKNAAVAVFDWVKGHWPLLLAILMGPFGIVLGQVIKNFGTIKKVVETTFNSIKSIVTGVASVVGSVLGGAFNAVKTAVEGVIKAIEKMIQVAKGIASLPGKALSAIGLQTGGYAHAPMTALVGERGPEMVHLPQGARVSPFVQSYSGGGGGGQHVVHVPVYLDRRQIALAMGSYTADMQASR